nr:uncharacterized protein si:dkey-220k22.3 [Misgurnus anguillicaudatus]
METAWGRTAKAHFIWTCVALLVVIVASCLTYVFMSMVPTCHPINIVHASSINLATTTVGIMSGQHFLYKALICNETDNHLVWNNEWKIDQENDTLLDDTQKWLVIKENGTYLFYMQANFQLNGTSILLKTNNPKVDLKLLVVFNFSEGTEIFAAAHDTQTVSAGLQDAKLNTFLKMDLKSKSKLSVKAFPCDMVNNSPKPFSTYITLIKWSDDW